MNNLYFCNKRIDKIVFILFLDCKCLFILNIQRGEKISKVIYIFSNNEEDEYFSHKVKPFRSLVYLRLIKLPFPYLKNQWERVIHIVEQEIKLLANGPANQYFSWAARNKTHLSLLALVEFRRTISYTRKMGQNSRDKFYSERGLFEEKSVRVNWIRSLLQNSLCNLSTVSIPFSNVIPYYSFRKITHRARIIIVSSSSRQTKFLKILLRSITARSYRKINNSIRQKKKRNFTCIHPVVLNAFRTKGSPSSLSKRSVCL